MMTDPAHKPRPKLVDIVPTGKDLPPLPAAPPLPSDRAPQGDGPPPAVQGRVPPVPSRDEANMEPDEALPEDSEEEIIDADPGRQKTRFDEELPPRR